MRTRPTTHNRAAAADLAARWRAAQTMLRACRLCAWRCGVDRMAGQRGRCGLTGATYLYKRYPSYNEEPELVPAYRIFLGACNLRCAFCDEAPQAFDPRAGAEVDVRALAGELAEAVAGGARSISVLGGEPTLHVHTLLAIAEAADNRLPLAVNTNLYMTRGVLDLLTGVVRWYLADVKFGQDDCAARIAQVPQYTRTVLANLEYALGRADVIVRHVLLPGHLECCFRPLVAALSRYQPPLRFQLYPGYVPLGAAARDPVLGRLNTRADLRAALAVLADSPLRWQTPPLERQALAGVSAGPAAGTARLTIGRDGRLYCHDLSATLLPVLAALAPHDSAPASRPGLASDTPPRIS